jgi:hypothetical protein
MIPNDPRRSTLILFGGTLTLTVALLFPLFPCRATDCGTAYRIRMAYSRLPGLTPEQAASIRRYADSDSCPRCTRFRRVSLAGLLLDSLGFTGGFRQS